MVGNYFGAGKHVWATEPSSLRKMSIVSDPCSEKETKPVNKQTPGLVRIPLDIRSRDRGSQALLLLDIHANFYHWQFTEHVTMQDMVRQKPDVLRRCVFTLRALGMVAHDCCMSASEFLLEPVRG